MSAIPASFSEGVITLSDDGGNSEVLQLSDGTLSFSGLVPDGRAVEKSQTRGTTTGLRKTERVYPTVSISGDLAAPSAAFHLLALGETGGFVSTTVGIGDAATSDMDFSFDYGAESRDLIMDDLLLTELSIEEGPISKISMTFEVIGPVTFDGTTVISTR